MVENIEIYQSGKLTFILTTEKIIIRTARQSFFLEPTQSLLKRKMCIIRTMIRLGEINDLNDLATSCGKNIGWVNTNQRFDIDNSPKFAKISV